MIDAGASVVWGTSSHHVQPVELHGDGVIVYGACMRVPTQLLPFRVCG